METMGMGNDERGWILAIISGVACVAGASVINIDILVRQLPGKTNWKIEDSNLFLSSGFSLSFGVLIFSALYKILPSSRRYLEDGGLSPRAAVFTLVGCFLIGAFAISVLSRILHRYIPHSVVDCVHEHGDEESGKVDEGEDEVSDPNDSHTPRDVSAELDGTHDPVYGSSKATHPELLRRPTLHTSISTKVSQLVSGSKEFCDENGRCYGYSDPCGQDCFRNVQARIPRSNSVPGGKLHTRGSGLKKLATAHERQSLLENVDETTVLTPSTPAISGHSTMESSLELPPQHNGHRDPSTYGTLQKHPSDPLITPAQSSTPPSHSHSHSHPHPQLDSHPAHTHTGAHQHHHHVPTNAFLSIGLQTSCAIALHKIPEGFITYATNHANPTLGVSIFLALFIHNITEGFAMALPLYLAIHSRWRAMFWSALLGGVSQPLGAGVAALWFHFAASRGGDRGEEMRHEDLVYGCMFAGTAGVMTMVGLQLFGESLELTHSRRVCFLSAFVGMGILGLSSALTA